MKSGDKEPFTEMFTGLLTFLSKGETQQVLLRSLREVKAEKRKMSHILAGFCFMFCFLKAPSGFGFQNMQ